MLNFKKILITISILTLVIMFINGCEEEVISTYEIIQITHSDDPVCPGSKFSPRCSPIDNRLSFICSQILGSYSIWVLDMDTNEYNNIIDVVDPPIYLSWSPDANFILFSDSGPNQTRDLYYISVENGLIEQQPVKIPLPEGHKTWEHDWSPDGEWIVYANDTDGFIWKIRIDGTEPTRLIEGSYPRWKSNGNKIVFDNNFAGVGGDIFTINSDGSCLTCLLSSQYSYYDARQPDWSPGGNYVVFFTLYGLHVVNDNGGGEPIKLTDVAGYLGHITPTWTYNCEYIVFKWGIESEDGVIVEEDQLYKINPKLGWGVE